MESPLSVKVINRNISPFEDELDLEENNLGESTPEPQEFSPEIKDEIEYNEEEDIAHANSLEVDEAKAKGRKILAKTILDAVHLGISKGVPFFTALPEDELNAAIVEAERKNKPQYKEIFEKCIQKNEKDAQNIENWTKFFTSQMEEPLREVMKNKGIDISPEQQLLMLSSGLVVTVGYLTYDIQKSNSKLLAEVMQLRKDMNSIEIKPQEEEVKK